MVQEYLLPILVLAGIGLLAGVVLVLAAKFMAVSADEKYELVRALLPGANCGACGYAGCDDYAAKLAAGEAPANLCVPGGGECGETDIPYPGERGSGYCPNDCCDILCRRRERSGKKNGLSGTPYLFSC